MCRIMTISYNLSVFSSSLPREYHLSAIFLMITPGNVGVFMKPYVKKKHLENFYGTTKMRSFSSSATVILGAQDGDNFYSKVSPRNRTLNPTLDDVTRAKSKLELRA